MASIVTCPYCGSPVPSDQKNCPGCGAPNEQYGTEPAAPNQKPKTIEELQAFCRARKMPLRKMRFFIGEDYRQPKAFGIYRDGDEVVVYKNKDNGERAIRYRGKFEERGVLEIYNKLLDECHRRGLYPEGKPIPVSRSAGAVSRPVSSRRHRRGGFLSLLTDHPFRLFLLLVLLTVIASSCSDRLNHRSDGYYRRPEDNGVYYHYGDDWYYSSGEDSTGFWYLADAFPEEEYETYGLGDTWDNEWGVSDFQESSTWDDLHSSSVGTGSSTDSDYDSWDSDDSDWDSSDYDSWDSGSTDWSSDW